MGRRKLYGEQLEEAKRRRSEQSKIRMKARRSDPELHARELQLHRDRRKRMKKNSTINPYVDSVHLDELSSTGKVKLKSSSLSSPSTCKMGRKKLSSDELMEAKRRRAEQSRIRMKARRSDPELHARELQLSRDRRKRMKKNSTISLCVDSVFLDGPSTLDIVNLKPTCLSSPSTCKMGRRKLSGEELMEAKRRRLEKSRIRMKARRSDPGLYARELQLNRERRKRKTKHSTISLCDDSVYLDGPSTSGKN